MHISDSGPLEHTLVLAAPRAYLRLQMHGKLQTVSEVYVFSFLDYSDWPDLRHYRSLFLHAVVALLFRVVLVDFQSCDQRRPACWNDLQLDAHNLGDLLG